jgi:hypothetical protein
MSERTRTLTTPVARGGAADNTNQEGEPTWER